jgi:hypothetical protein
MQQIIVEPGLGEKLSELGNQAVLCDSNGRALGLFSPLTAQPPVQDLQLEPPLSIAQTEELRKTHTGKPLAEILGRLGIQ